MKKIALVGVALLLTIASVGCNSSNKENTATTETGETKELTVFAAASMTETLEEIKTKYEEENDVKILYTFDSSGTLKTQIDEGANCDIFISAAQKQMNALDPEKGEVEGSSPIDSETRIDLLENKVTLAVTEGNPKDIKAFDEIGTEKVESIALGNSDVPVGQYSEELFTNLGIWDDIQPKVTYGSNVKEVTTWVSEGVVDCGVIYATDAYSAGLEVVAEADDSMLENKVIYPGAILENSENKEEAQKFLEYLQGEEASKIFESVGFAPVN
ncbi:MAG: molybdate ABC transporter substrate-binding protein [Tissierellia bacterium]|jgi:molybdate transport system substrate-binding protein|nr:molybdate ABC transporter substrate-binding protein [Tissierellia bacterium]